MVYPNFAPHETIPLPAGTSSASQAFKLAGSALQRDAMICNTGSVTAFIAFGKGSATATVPGTSGTTKATPIPPGAIMVLHKNLNGENDTVAAITASGSAQLYITAGTGY